MRKQKLFWRSADIVKTHRQTIASILGRNCPPVLSVGNRFYNQDRWTLRHELHNFSMNEKKDLEDIKPLIVIADTPKKITKFDLYYLVGGGYHEAWHTLYSCRRNLKKKEMNQIFTKERKEALKDLPKKKLASMLLEWSNIVEDIRIERNGIQQFPGSKEKMWALQDFIIQMESDAEKKPLAFLMPGQVFYSVVVRVFRDLGLGYETKAQEAALEHYKDLCPEAVDFVVEGPLKPFLEKAINLTPSEDTECGQMAMDIVGVLYREAQEAAEQAEPKEGDQQEGEGQGDGKEGDGKDGDNNGGQQGGEGDKRSEKISDLKEYMETDKGNEAQAGGMEQIVKDFLEAMKQKGKEGDPGKGRDLFSGFSHLDNNSALELKFDAKKKEESNTKGAPPEGNGEKTYTVATRAYDVYKKVQPSQASGRYLSIVQRECNAKALTMAAQLRQIIKQLEMIRTTHGVRKGRDLSERMFTDTYTTLRAGRNPKKAFWKRSEALDTKASACLVFDQSSSMSSDLQEMRELGYITVKALEDAGIKTCVVSHGNLLGYPDNVNASDLEDTGSYVRTYPTEIDIFKDFEDPFDLRAMKALMSVRAFGGTPLADAIHEGIELLSVRPEKHRLLVVFTDGQPNHDQTACVRHQVNTLAPWQGLITLGVGWDYGSEYVRKLFQNHVVDSTISGIPQKITQKLQNIIQF